MSDQAQPPVPPYAPIPGQPMAPAQMSDAAKRAAAVTDATTSFFKANMAVGVFALGLGAVGKVSAARQVMQAVANVSPDDRQVLLAAGMEESTIVLKFGALIGLTALLCGATCLAVQLRRLPRAEAK